MPTVIVIPTAEDWTSLCSLEGEHQGPCAEIMGNGSCSGREEEEI